MYVEDYAKTNKKSWHDDLYRLNANMKPFFGEIEIEDLTPLQIEQYRAKRLGKGVSKSTVNRELTIMKKMFNLALDWGLAEVNPVVKVRLFSEKDTQKERILSREEEMRLIAESPEYLRPILTVALNTGMRRGEILNLRWKQVDLQKRQILVQQTKSGKNRLIPINGLLYKELLSFKAINGKGELVFFNPRTGKPYTEVKKSFRSACQRAKILDLRFHDLRHTFATRLIEAGIDIITVKELLGHFSVRITQRYTHPGQNQKRNAVDLLAANGQKCTKKGEDLLHSCDAERPGLLNIPATNLNSIN